MFTDTINPSSIGNSYGDIYESQLEHAQNSRLNNKSDPNNIPVYFKEYIHPFLHEDIKPKL